MPKRKCKFTNELQVKYSCFRRGRDDFEGECMVCKPGTYVSVANKGGLDLQAHMDCEKHKRAVRGEASSTKLTQFLTKPGSEHEDKVSAAEGSFAFHTVKHHNSYKMMDCTSSLIKSLFPDSHVARKFSAARTKTEAIVNSVLGPHSIDSAMKRIQDNDIAYCGVSTDGSNHGSVKIFPIIIQYFDWKTGGVQSKLIELDQQPNETADTISSFLRNALEGKGLLDKCIAFTGDNCNTMFGGLRRDAEGKNVFSKLKKLLGNKTLIGVGCPAHILNNCVHQAVDTLDFDIEGIIFKLYQYFNIYTVRTEQLKQFSEFVDVEYKKLLSHSKTRWLSLLPGINRLIHMFPALKSFFLSQSKPPTIIKKFFENEFSEIYLYHLKTLVGMFHSRTEELERETNSLMEVLGILLSIKRMLIERKASEFMSIKVKILLEERRKNGLNAECDKFVAVAVGLYESCIEYLEKWMAPMQEFTGLMWMSLEKPPEWKDVESTIKYLLDKGVNIDDEKCFDQVCNLKKFVSEKLEHGHDFLNLQAHKKWTVYFEKSKHSSCHSELLKIAQFFFAIPSHNGNVERLFSLMQSQWTKERNSLSVESLRGILQVQYNYKDISCKEFHAYLMNEKELLKRISSTEKYIWATVNKEQLAGSK